jgi:diguanylate cyclase (GGDEF)-like protein
VGSARIGASMFAGGALVTAVGMLAPHSPQTDVIGFWWLFAVQLALACLLLVLPRSLGTAWIPGAVVALSIAVVSAAVFFNGERAGGPATLNELYYVWPALYVGYFFKRGGVIGAVLAIAGAYAATLVAIEAATTAALTRWMVTVSVAGGAALALHVIRRRVDRLLERLRELARTDPLTGLANRREFDARFEVELDRAQRSGEPFALALGDVDFFKRLNDEHGHAAGDAALRAVARSIAASARRTDLCARVGGEEFAVLLPGTTASLARPMIERLRRHLATVSSASGEPLTVSFGLVEFPAHGTSMRALMHAADMALYDAKATGRDRLVLGSQPALEPAAG